MVHHCVPVKNQFVQVPSMFGQTNASLAPILRFWSLTFPGEPIILPAREFLTAADGGWQMEVLHLNFEARWKYETH